MKTLYEKFSGLNLLTFATSIVIILSSSIGVKSQTPCPGIETITINHLAGVVAPVDKTVTYGTVTNIPGEPSKCWITSNLGANHQATAVDDATEESAGWYWQFNRKQGYKHDGTTRTPNTTWITSINENLDWEAANDPCAIELGIGWRIPTSVEWTNVDASGGWTDWNDPWNSGLKLHAGGWLNLFGGGSLAGGMSGYWSSKQGVDNYSFLLLIMSNSDVGVYGFNKANGYSLRCIRDAAPTVTTSSISNINQTTAISGGNVTSDGGASVTARGICWSTTDSPTISNSKTSDGTGTGTFSSDLSGLLTNTQYYVRAYATNIIGTAYGNQQTFYTLPPDPTSATASINTICNGSSTQLTANGAVGIVYWYTFSCGGTEISAGNPQTVTPTITTTYYARNFSNEQYSTGCASVTITVNQLIPVSVSITESINSVCAGTNVTYTATPTNGGESPSYQWKVNGTNVGDNNPVYAYVPANNDVVTCVLTSSETLCVIGNPATSNSIIMDVNPNLPVSVTISASANPVCDGTTVDFTATTSNGGTVPSYQWKVNGINAGVSQITYSYAPANNDVINCVLTSNAVCTAGNPATSNQVFITVNPSVTSTTDIEICAYQLPYIWNGYSYAIAGTYSVTLQSVSGCDSVATLILIVNPAVIPVISILANNNPICSGTMVTFSATAISQGNTPIYQWMKNGILTGTNESTYQDNTLINGDVISCKLTSNATCATPDTAISESIIMTVNPLLTPTIAIISNQNPICSGTMVTFSATATNQGSNPFYEWKKNSVHVGNNSQIYTSNTLTNNDLINCVLTSNAVCTTGNPATSNVVTMGVNPSLPVSVSIVPSANPICSETPVTFTAIPTNGGSSPSYQWKKNGSNIGNNIPVYSYVPENNDVITCQLTSSETGCITGSPATSNSVTMVVNPAVAVSVTIAASQNNVCTGTSVTFTATPVGGGTPTYQWFKNAVAVGSGASYASVPVNGDVVYVVMTSSLSCSTGSPATSNSFTMVVNQIPATPVITLSGNTLISNAPSGNQWYFEGNPISGATSQTHIATLSGWYWCTVTLNGCSSDTSNHVHVIITGMLELPELIFTVYPIPNDGRFTASITSAFQQIFTIQVYNKIGQPIYEMSDISVKGKYEQQFDLRPIASGIYTVVLRNQEGVIVRKIIINK